MKTTGILIKVACHYGVQKKIRENHPCKDRKRTSGTRSRMRIKKTAVLRVDRRPEPGIQIQIETKCRTEMGEEVVSRCTPMTMTMSLNQRALSHLTPIPRLHPQLLQKGCRQSGFQAAPSLRQVNKERIYAQTD